MNWILGVSLFAVGVILGWFVFRSNKHPLHSILARLHDGVIVLNDDNEVIYNNQRAAKLLHINSDAPEKIRLAIARTPELIDYLQSVATGEQEKEEITVEVGYPDVKYLKVQASVISRNNVLVTLSDVTRLYELEQIRSQFTADLSHQLRTPVTSIRLLAENLENEESSHRETITRIYEETQRLEDLVNEILMLSRLEGEEIEVDCNYLSINEVVTEAVEGLKPKIKDNNLKLNTDLQYEDCWWGDHDKLVHVVSIYLDNAIKFSPAGGIIEIKSYKEENNNILIVSDEGPGISQEERQHVFQRFYRGKRSPAKSGFGLGLAIAKHLIAAHGGDVFVSSEVGYGSNFGFTIPK